VDNPAHPLRLSGHAVPYIDKQQGTIRIRRTGQHVADVLLVAGRVGDNKTAALGTKVAICDVDRDTLLALGFKPVEQQRIVELVASAPVATGQARQRGKLVVGPRAGLREQSAHQGRFSVVDRSAGDEPQLIPIGVDKFDLRSGAVHQKYPSRFLRSMADTSSASIKRPKRSDLQVARNSSTMSSTFSASEGIAAVKG